MRPAGLIVTAAAAALLLGGLAAYVLFQTPSGDFPAVELRSDRERPQGDVLRGTLPEPTTLNPFTTTDAAAVRYVLPFTHDTLFDRDPADGSLRPAAARSAEFSDDRRTLTFTLRDDLRFSDGEPVTLSDLRFTLEVALHPRTADGSDMSYYLQAAGTARAPDAQHLVVEFEKPALDGDRAQLATSIRIAQRAWFVTTVQAEHPSIEVSDGEPLSDEFVDALCGYRGPGLGTGAYRLAMPINSIGQTRRIDLAQNPHSWRRDAQPTSWNLAGLRYELTLDDAARFVALQQDRIDWFAASGGTPSSVLLEENPDLAERFTLHRYDPIHLGHYFVLWNCGDELLKNKTVRRALGMLFDREALLEAAFQGSGSVARGYFKPSMAEYPGPEFAPRFDPRAARELLESVDGLDLDAEKPRIQILLPAQATQRRIVEMASSAFEQAGLELAAVPADPVEIGRRVQSGDFQGLILVEQHELPIDPYGRFHSRENQMNYASEAMDRVLEQARASTDPAERLTLYRRFHEILRDEQPVTLLVHPQIELLLHRRFEDAAPGPLGLWPERFWVRPDQQKLAPGPAPR